MGACSSSCCSRGRQQAALCNSSSCCCSHRAALQLQGCACSQRRSLCCPARASPSSSCSSIPSQGAHTVVHRELVGLGSCSIQSKGAAQGVSVALPRAEPPLLLQRLSLSLQPWPICCCCCCIMAVLMTMLQAAAMGLRAACTGGGGGGGAALLQSPVPEQEGAVLGAGARIRQARSRQLAVQLMRQSSQPLQQLHERWRLTALQASRGAVTGRAAQPGPAVAAGEGGRGGRGGRGGGGAAVTAAAAAPAAALRGAPAQQRLHLGGCTPQQLLCSSQPCQRCAVLCHQLRPLCSLCCLCCSRSREGASLSSPAPLCSSEAPEGGGLQLLTGSCREEGRGQRQRSWLQSSSSSRRCPLPWRTACSAAAAQSLSRGSHGQGQLPGQSLCKDGGPQLLCLCSSHAALSPAGCACLHALQDAGCLGSAALCCCQGQAAVRWLQQQGLQALRRCLWHICL
jgi:hypothetical protein